MDAQTPEDGARLPRAATLAAGREAGLTAVGAAALVPWPQHAAALDAWLAAGAAADLDWMGTTAARRKDPRVHWPWARHALVGALSYHGEPAERAGAPNLLKLLVALGAAKSAREAQRLVAQRAVTAFAEPAPGVIGSFPADGDPMVLARAELPAGMYQLKVGKTRFVVVTLHG